MKHGVKFRFYPTKEQAELLTRTFGCVRVVWNDSLRYRTDAWYNESKRVNYNSASARLTELKKNPEFEWLNEVSCVPLQQALRHQQGAFTNFFEKRNGYPSFKSKKNRNSAEFTRSAFKWSNGQLTLAKMKEPLDIRLSRTVPSEPSTVTVSCDPAGRWHVSMLCDDEITKLPERTESIGIDVGISAFATLSTGEKIGNPRFLKNDLDKLADAQRQMCKKQKGSNNRNKARIKVARVHARIADKRNDHSHKLSTRLVRENQTIVVEDLNIRGMVKMRSLSQAISDVGWGEFIRQLEYKSEWYGRELVKVDRWFPSSKRCSNCGFVHKFGLEVRSWTCPECATTHDRDVNAAINILAAGLAVKACGDGVRPSSQYDRKASVVETGNTDSDVRIPRL